MILCWYYSSNHHFHRMVKSTAWKYNSIKLQFQGAYDSHANIYYNIEIGNLSCEKGYDIMNKQNIQNQEILYKNDMLSVKHDVFNNIFITSNRFEYIHLIICLLIDSIFIFVSSTMSVLFCIALYDTFMLTSAIFGMAVFIFAIICIFLIREILWSFLPKRIIVNKQLQVIYIRSYLIFQFKIPYHNIKSINLNIVNHGFAGFSAILYLLKDNNYKIRICTPIKYTSTYKAAKKEGVCIGKIISTTINVPLLLKYKGEWKEINW